MPKTDVLVRLWRRMQRILIATDFSRGAHAALERAALLPLSPRPEIALVHVLPAIVPPGAVARSRAALAKQGRRLERLIRTSASQTVGVQLDVLHGTPFLEITQWARGMGTELLVVGRRGWGQAPLSVGPRSSWR